MSEASESAVQGEPFWRQHVLTAQNFMGSDVEYCRRNGLNAATFSTYKVKLGFSKHKKQLRAAGFIELKPEGTGIPPVSREAQPPSKVPRTLPDPKWTAEFISALFAMQR